MILVNGEHRSMLTERGANAELDLDLDLDGIPDELIRDHVHLTGHTMAARAVGVVGGRPPRGVSAP